MPPQAPAATASTPQVKLRQSISQLSAADLARFRAAMTTFLARPDNKGFQYFANWHGVGFDLCKHHDDVFLPWHRGYLYHYELALQDIDPQVTVPWWNWMDEPGLPAAFTHPAAGNPLLGADIRPMGVQVDPGWPTHTERDPGEPDPGGGPAALPPPLRKANVGGREVDFYDNLMNAPTYREFEQLCWQLHDNVHVWVGGQMSDQNFAAYDPLFWSHHAMVDRLWRIWQHNHGSALPPQNVLGASLTFAAEPSMKVSELLDVTALGYDYAALATSSAAGTA